MPTLEQIHFTKPYGRPDLKRWRKYQRNSLASSSGWKQDKVNSIITSTEWDAMKDGLSKECRTEETVKHFVLKYPKYYQCREKLLVLANQHKVNLEIPEILRSPYARTTAIEFLLTAERFI